MTENLEKEYIEEDAQKGRYLTFSLEGEIFGLEIKYVTEIIGMQMITKMPEVPIYLKGIINLRGKIIPVVDVRLLFNKPEIAYDDRTCIVVVDIDSVLVGLIVDNVDEVLNIGDDLVAPPPSTKTGFENRFMKGIGKANGKVQLLLDCERLLKREDLQAIETVEE